MDVTKPYKFIGFGAMDVTKPYKFIGFGATTHFAPPGHAGMTPGTSLPDGGHQEVPSGAGDAHADELAALACGCPDRSIKHAALRNPMPQTL